MTRYCLEDKMSEKRFIYLKMGGFVGTLLSAQIIDFLQIYEKQGIIHDFITSLNIDRTIITNSLFSASNSQLSLFPAFRLNWLTMLIGTIARIDVLRVVAGVSVAASPIS